MALRALQRRIAKMEKARKPRPSPLVLACGSLGRFVEVQALVGIEDGRLDPKDMIEIVAALRDWEDKGLWAVAHG